MNFLELKDIIENLTMRANYQPIVIKKLLMHGDMEKAELAQHLCSHNLRMDQNASYFMHVPVWNVLQKKGVISINGKVVSLNAKLSSGQNSDLVHLCNKKIQEAKELVTQ